MRGGLEDGSGYQVIAAFSPSGCCGRQRVNGAPDQERARRPLDHWSILWQMNAAGLRGEGDFERAVHDEGRTVSGHDAQAPREGKQLVRGKVFFAQLDGRNAAINRFVHGVNERVRSSREAAVSDEHQEGQRQPGLKI